MAMRACTDTASTPSFTRTRPTLCVELPSAVSVRGSAPSTQSFATSGASSRSGRTTYATVAGIFPTTVLVAETGAATRVPSSASPASGSRGPTEPSGPTLRRTSAPREIQYAASWKNAGPAPSPNGPEPSGRSASGVLSGSAPRSAFPRRRTYKRPALSFTMAPNSLAVAGAGGPREAGSSSTKNASRGLSGGRGGGADGHGGGAGHGVGAGGRA